MFGLELQTAYLTLQSANTLPLADNDYWGAKVRNLFKRPAVEPVMTSLWQRTASLILTPNEALRVASLLTGYPLQYRTTRAIGESRDGDVYFEPLEAARDWPQILETEVESEMLGKPVYLFAKTIMAHPFIDGNGRFARFLFAFALARQLNVTRPCIALAPSFYRHAQRASTALSVLSATKDWRPLTRVLIDIVDEAIMLTEMVPHSSQLESRSRTEA
ncbi:Fic family protein [Sphingomonas sp. CARO-RG-8B-R24-01]|uniref:Fic family protein n=1 Tax=Sphingomonas sp. CARO-RG-8B-R24-01 TaxID=2914831 RepID=UPI001F585A12|nr:Fic family protein [Sphingomonas sp. CARO-RG-8B-R24-01]